jgi:hypothetical protein
MEQGTLFVQTGKDSAPNNERECLLPGDKRTFASAQWRVRPKADVCSALRSGLVREPLKVPFARAAEPVEPPLRAPFLAERPCYRRDSCWPLAQ